MRAYVGWFLALAIAGCTGRPETPESAAATWPSARPFPKVTIVERTTEPVLGVDRPWENYCVNYCKVLRIDGTWHMWYQCFPAPPRSDMESYLCYARSADGVHWAKPSLGLVDFGGSRNNNILGAGIVGHDVFLDPSADATERFKMVYVKAHGGECWVYGGGSPDGIHWRWLDEPLLARNSDTQVVCIREVDKYRLYVRMWTEGASSGKRAVGYTESATFGNFPPPRFVLAPQASDPADLHFYHPAASKVCDGLYLLLPSAFYTGDQTVRPHLAFSRDGPTIERIGREPVLDPGPGFDAMGVYVAPGLIVADQPNTYWMYYLGVPQGHDAADAVAARKAGIGRFKVVLTSP